MTAMTGGLRHLASRARHVPMLGDAFAQAYRRYFDAARGDDVRLFRGVFPSFETAALNIPSGRPLGYDNPRSATRMLGEWLALAPSDYPVMFWLAKLLPGSKTLFDWGGSVGLKYFTFRPYLEYPADLTWVVSDVPAVVELGREIARCEAATALHFTTGFESAANTDILLAAGVMQFIDDPFGGLRALPRLPRHLIINKTPVYDRPSAVTLHNMGTAFCPYRLFNRLEFMSAAEALGYRLVDQWRSPDVGCQIPFHPEHSIGAYSGFYFTRND